MILIDVNLLLFANNPQAPEHHASLHWYRSIVTEGVLVRLAWQTVWAFLRLSTGPRVFGTPLTSAEAVALVCSWLAQPNVAILEPGDRHWEILGELVKTGQATGPLIADASLAAIAIEHGAVLYSTDRDFARFERLKWVNPLA